MQNEQILPVLNMDVLKEAANKWAMNGALKSIEEYYSGYNSPFRKVIEEELKKTEIGYGIALTDIIALINDSLSKEIELLANTAISKTFVPMVQKFLTREKKELDFSDVLKEFIEITDCEYDDCSVEVVENKGYGWLDITLEAKGKEYKLTLHKGYEDKTKYTFHSLPHDYNKHTPTMKLSIDGATLEMPFTRDVLQDNFVSFIARLIIANTKITMDVTDFHEHMFPQDECHC